MTKLNLTSLYRDATRDLPQDAELRVTADELVALASGQLLGARRNAVVHGLAVSSEQARAASVAMATRSWSKDLAADLAKLRRPTLTERVAAWFTAATLPPVFAACAISLLAIAAWRVGEPGTTLPASMPPQLAADDALFGGDFDEAVAHRDTADTLFDGGFDS
jgi:hypothetical protein